MMSIRNRIICGMFVFAVAIGSILGVDQFKPEERSINIVSGKDIREEDAAASADKNINAGAVKVNAKSAVLMDADSGTVLMSKNAHKELPPASVTKVMTMLLVLEAVENGKFKLSDEITVSERAASMGGSQMYMEPGEKHTVDELMMGVAMVSANDACVALAEHVSGSVEMFVEKMNKRAKELKMKNTNFVNTNGLPAADHYTSAYDIAVMSSELLKHKKIEKWFTDWQATVKVGLPGKEKEFGLTNTNRLIKQYSGAIGVKTGFTQDAGYCLSGAAKRNGTTLVGVVMGCKTSPLRFAEMSKILDYGFANFETVKIAKKGEILKRVKIEKGTEKKIGLAAKEDITALVKKGEKKSVTTKTEANKDISLPVKKGKKLGEIAVLENKREVKRVDLAAAKTVQRASLLELYKEMLKKLI